MHQILFVSMSFLLLSPRSFQMSGGKTADTASGFLSADPMPFPCKKIDDGMKVKVAVENSLFSEEFAVDAVGKFYPFYPFCSGNVMKSP